MLVTPGMRVRRYEIGVPIGAGGMGEVYMARDLELDRTVALKILPGDAAADPERIRRFVQEAKAACALSHPNVAHIYDVGEENGIRFMAMEYVDGESLRRRIGRAQLSVDAALDIAIQIASALASAHDAGVVHRDIKPENVMLRPDGYVKVLDFGLAKLVGTRVDEATDILKTEPGVVMGTMHYMSPEQLRGEPVDARADIFSLGVLLHELLTGARPFQASSSNGVIAAILTETPNLDAIPEELRGVIAKALAKKRDDRYASAHDMLDDLRRARSETKSNAIRSGDLPTQILSTAPPKRSRRSLVVIAAIVVVIAIATWLAIRARNVRHAREAIPRVEQLADQHQYFEAWDLGQSIRPLTGSDERLAKALQKVSNEVTIETEPAGARVYLQRYADTPPPRELLGTTPIAKRAIPRGDYILTIEKEGFAPFSRTLSTLPLSVQGIVIDPPVPEIHVKLLEVSKAPPRMVFIPGGAYRLGGYRRPSDASVKLNDYFLDKYEVSNREYEKFIRAGGYNRPELAAYHDATGLPGPRSWASGTFPQGRGDYPVTDISWQEANAYAQWAGKKLPTIFQWDKAARTGEVPPFGQRFPWGAVTENDVTRRANFGGGGPMPVDSMPFGMSAYGAHHLAGNVSEWCRNAYGEGYATMGGGFDDPVYQFGNVGSFPGTFASPKIGFRCVKEIGTPADDQGGFALSASAEVPAYTPASDKEFKQNAARYDYANTPLDAKVVERTDADAWTREKITYRGANGKTVIAFLYLPKGAKRPLQLIHFAPASDIAEGKRPLTHELEELLAPHIRAGRAVFGVILEGYLERPYPAGWEYPDPATIEFVDDNVAHVTDIRRGLDYLATRPDIDMTRIAFFGPSAGSSLGIVLTAVEPRYRAVFFIGGGLRSTSRRYHHAASRIDFAPHVRTPILMMHGRWDEVHPLKTNAEPLFKLLPEPKKLVVYDGGHMAPQGILVPTVKTWLDQVLGPVQ